VPRDDRQAPLGPVGCRCERVDRRHLEREFNAPDSRQVDRQAEQVGTLRQGREPPSEGEREVLLVWRRDFLRKVEDGIFESQQDSWVDLESQV